MPPVINQEWLNQNSLRNYPFREDVRLNPEDADGNRISDIRFPNFVVVDFVLTMPTPTVVSVYLSTFSKVSNLATFTFSDESGLNVATLAVDVNQHTKNQAYNLVGIGTYADVRGRVVIGSLIDLPNVVPDGLYNFSLDGAELEPATVRPDIRGVRSLQVDQGGTLSAQLFGHVKLVEGVNIQLTHLPAYNAIRIDAIDGAGLNTACDCDDPLVPVCIESLNGIPLANVDIIGDDCVDVSVEGNRIVISDKCAEPCCGCPELEFITENLKVLEATVSNLQEYAQELHQRVFQFVTSFVLTVQGQ
jgi:hypothetical protein